MTALTNVTWMDVVGCSTNGSSLTKTDPTFAWSAGAASVQTLSGNGYVEFTIAETGAYMMAGLVNTYGGPSYQTIDYAIYLTGDTYVVIYEDGTYVEVFGTYAAGDVFEINVVGSTVTYLQNSNLLYTSHKTPTLPLRFAASIFKPGAAVNNVAFNVPLPLPSQDQRTLVVLTPDTPFLSGATVSVSVQASDFNGLPIQPGPTVYSFAIADTTAPELLGASAQDVETVRVTWTEAVVAVSPLGANDALNPALYTFTPVIGGVVPAVPAGATSIAAVSGLTNTFDVTTSTELSPGILYSLAVAGVEDPSGNSEIALITFTAFTPPAPARRFFDLYRVLPRYNRDADVSLDLKRFVACIQEPATLLLYDIDRWTDILDVDIAAEQYLDAMLADLGNPFPFILSVTDKRRLIRLLVPIYQQKGTPDGIINTVRFFLGLTITIVPYDGEGMQLGVSQLGLNWILGPGNSFALYAFRIISGIALTAEQIEFIANYMKPAHTHLIEIVQPSTPPTYDPLELGISRLGDDWLLHA